jgi:hypothetical protein
MHKTFLIEQPAFQKLIYEKHKILKYLQYRLKKT